MAKRYYIGGDNDGNKVPCADAVFETDKMSFNEESGVLFIAFYDSNGDIVTPTAGTVTPEGSAIEGQWLTPSSGDAVIDCTEVIAGSATYTTPVFVGCCERVRITMADVDADSFIAFIWKKA